MAQHGSTRYAFINIVVEEDPNVAEHKQVALYTKHALHVFIRKEMPTAKSVEDWRGIITTEPNE